MTVKNAFLNRDQWRSMWLECYRSRYVEADGTPIPVDTGPGSYPYLRASVMADMLVLQSATAQSIALGHLLDGLSGDQLDSKFGSRLPRILSTKSRGFLKIETGTAGARLQPGDKLAHADTGNTYSFMGSETKVFLDGSSVPVESTNAGEGQNLEAGAVLNWVAPRAGCYSTCKVEGRGIHGARGRESDDEYRARIRYFNANPAGQGNEAELLVLIEESDTNAVSGRPGHGVPVEKGFVYPALRGPGTAAWTFTVKSDNWYQTRCPTALEIQDVQQYVATYMPKDSLWAISLLEQDVTIDLSVTLRPTQWADCTPWPMYSARGAGCKVITAATSPTSFSIGTDDGDYAGEVAPAVGNTIAVFDRTQGMFFRKTVKTVAGYGPWDVTIDTQANESDATFTPIIGTAVSPWADALQSIVDAVGKHVASLGPGEAISHPGGGGVRQARVPAPTRDGWGNKLVRVPYVVVDAVPAIVDARLLAHNPEVLPAPNTFVTAMLYRLSDLGVFAT